MYYNANAKEIKNIQEVFDIIEDGFKLKNWFQFSKCPMIFDVKKEDFYHKIRLVTHFHMTDAPAMVTCVSVVSRETMQIVLPMTVVIKHLT